jgi:hypothetical protein
MKRLFLAVAVTTAATLLSLTAGTARADSATHYSASFSFTTDAPAGTLCDFHYEGAFTIRYTLTIAPNGEDFTEQQTQYNTHTNLDTGYSLSEVDHTSFAGQVQSGRSVNTGIFWHLRDASGNNVLVNAGEATFDINTGELISFTPNSSFDQTFAQIICPALGGSPA